MNHDDLVLSAPILSDLLCTTSNKNLQTICDEIEKAISLNHRKSRNLSNELLQISPINAHKSNSPIATMELPSIPILKIEKTDLEKRQFILQTFHTIENYFSRALEEIKLQNPSLDYLYRRITNECFITELFLNGSHKGQCKIWIPHNGYSRDSIHYNQDLSETSWMDAIRLSNNKFELSLCAWNLQEASPEQIAEYLWKKLTEQLRH